MRITIRPVGLPELVLVSDPPTRAPGVHLAVLDPMPDGLEGWFEPAQPESEEPPGLPGQHGTFWPDEVYLRARAFTIRGWHTSTWYDGSSVTEAMFRDSLAALLGVSVTVIVEDSAGVREVTGYVPAQPSIIPATPTDTEFSIIIRCPDPLKYGQPVAQSVPAGDRLAVLENTGTGDVAFVVSTASRIQSLEIVYEGSRVAWLGDSLGLVLDLADGVPLNPQGVEVGYLVAADAIRIPPGRQILRVTSDAPVTLTIRPGWK